MPELPEVETVRRGLAPHMTGRIIRHLTLNRPDLRFPFPQHFKDRLTGARIQQVSRRAKYLLIHVEDAGGDEAIWLSHLGMTGRFEIRPGGDGPAPALDAHFYAQAQSEAVAKHVHVQMELDDGTHIHYADPRRFGYMDLFPADTPYPAFVRMGPEPDAHLTFEDFYPRLTQRGLPIKSALLNQGVIAGLGNIYVCEALFRAGISPRRKANRLGPVRVARLIPAIQDVIAEAIAAGGSTLRDFRHSDGALGYFQHRFAVYDRAGAPCLQSDCTGIVQRIVQSGRSTFFCPHCQR